MAKAKHPDFGNQPTATIDSTATQQIPAGDGITLRSNVQDTSTVTSTTDSTRGSLSNISTTSIKQTENRDDNSSAFDSSSDTECDDETITRVIERIPNELAPGETRMIQNGRLMLGPETINPELRPPPSIGSIVLQNSSDITFGNKTYINGQVVFLGPRTAGYQKHENEAVETSSSKKEPPATLSSQAKSWQSSLKALIKDKPLLSSILITTLICFLSTGLAIICILTASEGDIFPDPKPLRLVTRSEWLAQPPREVLTDLKLPVDYVIVVHTATEGCTTQNKCIAIVRNIQKVHMSNYIFDDIGYNFLIGGDGFVYEGRGWNKEGKHTKGYNTISEGVAFIGNYDHPTIVQMELLSSLLLHGTNSDGQNNQNNLLLPNNTNSIKYERYIVYGVILLFVAAALVISFYFLYKSLPVRGAPNDQGTIFGNNYVSYTIPNLGNGHMLIDRYNWGAQQGVQGKYELVPPIPYVLITHIGVHSRQCMNVHTCSIKMRTLQDAAIAEKSLQDIQSNFYLGGDGNIYVGRGWNRANAYANKSLAICFMGDYGRYEPNEDQFSALEHLLTYGETHNLLTQDFRLVAHSQTRLTRSPGIKLYEKIIKLPRWNPCGTPGYEHCGLEIGLPKVWDQEYAKPEVSVTNNGTVEISTNSLQDNTTEMESATIQQTAENVTKILRTH